MRKKISVFSVLFLAAVLILGISSAKAEEPQLEGIAYIQGHGGHIAVLDLKTGEIGRIVHGKPSDALTVSEDGETIYTFSLDGFAKVIDLKTGTQTEWEQLGKKHCGTAVAPDGMIWVSDMDDGKVYIYDPKAKKLADSFPVSKSICGISFSKDGKFAYISDMPGGFINVVEVSTKKVVKTFPGAGVFIHRQRMTPDGTEIWQSDGKELKEGKPYAVGYTDSNGQPGTVNIVDTKTGQVKDSVLIGGNPHDVDFTPDGKYAIVASRLVPETDDSALVVVDTKTKRIVKMYSACKKCHGTLGVKVPDTKDGGRPFSCAVQVKWDQKKIPASVEPCPDCVAKQ
ncbi:hypothetical protein MCHI_002071 [Candidatus Magnetoovum chiemensis]|nr:hypothetical protein MCHI_002071 [Candidatus Magnetoovum chiemensis]